MAKKTLSPKLIQLRDNMPCGNPDCNIIFKATDSQTFHYWYEEIPAYCSPECKKIGMGAKVRAAKTKPPQLYGPCPTCDDMFESKDPDRKYCSLYCWLSSPEFEEHLRKNSLKGAATNKRNAEAARPLCPVCEIEKVKPGSKYCSVRCYRQFLADLFDKWVANPERVGTVTNYDEWLLQEELPCLIEGCTWKGKNLSTHLNRAHGVRVREFKQLAGFNLSTGLVSNSHKGKLSERNNAAVPRAEFLARLGKAASPSRNNYFSKEAKEHRLKAQALKDADPEAFVPRRVAVRRKKKQTTKEGKPENEHGKV